jgi:hypothetical protein
MNISCPFVFVECKNYTSDPANPELDQLSGRFSVNRGRFGILVSRSFTNRALFIQRCNDTYRDNRGLIIPLEDREMIRDLTLATLALQKGVTDAIMAYKHQYVLYKINKTHNTSVTSTKLYELMYAEVKLILEKFHEGKLSNYRVTMLKHSSFAVEINKRVKAIKGD